MSFRFQIRRDTAENWSEVNPILAQGELGYEIDTGKLKIGDGQTPWNDLPYFSGGVETFVGLEDTPSTYQGAAGKLLIVKATEDGIEFVDPIDEKVKADSNDPKAGYLSDKVDNQTIEVDTANHVIKVKDGVFAPIDHTHSIDSLENVDATDKAPNTILVWNGTSYVYEPVPASTTELTDNLYIDISVLKNLAAYLALTYSLSNYVIADPSTSNATEVNVLAKVPANDNIVYTLDITRPDGTTPTTARLIVTPLHPDLSIQISFDGSTYANYNQENEISVTGNTLYVKVVNSSTTSDHYTYGVVVATD